MLYHRMPSTKRWLFDGPFLRRCQSISDSAAENVDINVNKLEVYYFIPLCFRVCGTVGILGSFPRMVALSVVQMS